MLAIWDDGVWQDAARVAVILLVAYLVIMWIAALVWTYRDITSRTRDQFTHGFSVLLVALFNLPGLFVYLILRPKDTIADLYDRQLEAEALLQEIQEQATCPSCRRRVNDDFLSCPYCRAPLRTPCESCDRALAFGWVVCPYCGSDRNAATDRRTVPGQPDRASAPPVAPLAAPKPVKRASTATYTPPARPAPTAGADADPGS